MLLHQPSARPLSSALVVVALLVLDVVAIITGVTGNGVQVRREILDLVSDTTQYSLFIQAVAAMQAADQTNPLSYYQLAGIHGRPQAAWDGVNGVAYPQAPGYATHGSNLFTSWHRAFLALFEQTLVSAAITVANQYPPATRATYVAAANKLRLPYFDWAKTPPAAGVFPRALSSPFVTIVTPTGSKSVTNPLYAYNFHPDPGDLYYQPFTYWNTTLRWPDSMSNVNAKSQNSLAASNLASWQPSLKNRLYTLLTQYTQYNEFSNQAWITDASSQDSLESIHDVVHGAIGGSNYGHMSLIDVAAFDIAFFMHHAMIDRCFALWQVVNPNSWFQPQTQTSGTFWYQSGYVSKSNTPLKPFKQTASTYWTTDSVRSWTTFSYTYPELTTGYTTASVKSAINTLYGSSSSKSKVKRSQRRNLRSAIGGLRSRLPGARPDFTLAGTSSTIRDYTANIRVQKNAFGQSYFIYFFLGPYSSDPTQWSFEPNFVAANPVISTLMTPAQVAAAKPVIQGAAVPLSVALEKKIASGELNSLGESDVDDYLSTNLHWEVIAMNGTVYQKEAVPNLLVSVVSTEIQPAQNQYSFPKRVGSTTKIHLKATQNKVAGLCDIELKLYTGALTS